MDKHWFNFKNSIMKTTAFFATAILFLGFGPQVFSQDYPMPAPGARWGMYYTDDFGAAYGILHSYTFTDTVINGTQYINWSHGFFLTRYDSQKVFRYNVSAKKEFCIYDFSLNLDDSIYLSPSYFSERDSILLYVKDVSTIKLKNGQTRKVMHLKTKDNADDFIGNIVEYWWIEGIGDMDQGFFYAKPFGMVQE